MLLVLEDVHLADESLLTYIDSIVQAPPPRVQIVLTYRPERLRDRARQVLKLTGNEYVERFQLGSLTRSDISTYLNRRFDPNLFPADLAQILYQLTDGLPIFLKRITEHLCSVGLIAKDGGKQEDFWRLACPVQQVLKEVPKDVESVVDLTFADLDADQRRAVLAGALQGKEFESAVLSQVLGEEAAAVEARLTEVANKSDLIHFERSCFLGKHGASARYRFGHSLYLRGALRALEREPTTRARWTQVTAETLGTMLPLDANGEATLLHSGQVRASEARAASAKAG